jgi:hypothetical protein
MLKDDEFLLVSFAHATDFVNRGSVASLRMRKTASSWIALPSDLVKAVAAFTTLQSSGALHP